MAISVLIATYNRAPMLERCLAQLGRQAFEPGDDIVVVDNGSTDATEAVIRRAAVIAAAPVQYVREPRPGKSNALTTGLRTARGSIIALTDDDVLVADDWIAAIRRVWQEQDPGLAGGRVLPLWEEAAPAWLRLSDGNGYGVLSAPLALVDYGPDPCPLGDRTALGANMVVSHRALIAAGGFPLTLGKLRGTLLSGEDHQICERVQQAGFSAIYDPRLSVRHHVPTERMRIAYHLRWFFWSGITNAAIDRATRPAPVPLRHWIGRTARGTRRAVAGIIGRRPHAAVEGLVDVAFSLGYVAGVNGWIHAGPAGPGRAEHVEAV